MDLFLFLFFKMELEVESLLGKLNVRADELVGSTGTMLPLVLFVRRVFRGRALSRLTEK